MYKNLMKKKKVTTFDISSPNIINIKLSTLIICLQSLSLTSNLRANQRVGKCQHLLATFYPTDELFKQIRESRKPS